MSRFSASFAPFPKLALGAAAALAAIGLSPGTARASMVTVNGVQCDVTTFTGKDVLPNTNPDCTGRFDTLANGGAMPWWGDRTLAQQFAQAVGNRRQLFRRC